MFNTGLYCLFKTDFGVTEGPFFVFDHEAESFVQIRSGVGAYAGAARRRVHLATVLLRPPSSHRLGTRQARHAHIVQIGLRLAIAQADARPAMPISFR